MWAEVTSHGMKGPYFFHQNGNMFRTEPIDIKNVYNILLKRRKFYSNAVRMQDDASPHIALTAIDMLTASFPYKVIGEHFNMPWPPSFPDLIQMNYYL